MAETLKLGNGIWATKEGSLLAYNDENGNYKPLPFDFTRASSATVVNKDGLIEIVGGGVPRIDFKDDVNGALLLEPQRTNLVIYSEDFSNAHWTKTGATIQGDPSTAGSELVVNGDFSDGLNNWSVVGGSYASVNNGILNSNNTVNGSWHSQYIGQDIAFVNGKTYKVKFSAKNVSGFLNLRITQGSNIIYNNNLTNEFTEYVIYYTANANNGSIRLFCNDQIGEFEIDNISVKEVQGYSAPSVDSPLNAFKLVEGTNNGGHNIQRVENVSNATIYTSSVFVKYGGREWIRFTDAQSSNRIHFNTLTGAFGAINGTVINYKSIALSNGWYKLSITTTSVATAYALRVSLAEADNDVSYTGNGTSGVYIYGAQLELGSYATSYIPTQGSTVTRIAEKCEQNLSNVVSLTEGVVYIDTINLGNDGTNSNIISQNSVVDTVYCLKVGSNNKIACGLFASSVNIPINSTSAYPLGTRTKIAFHYKSGNSKLYINGSLEGTNNASFTLGSGFATALRLIDASSAYNASPQKSIVREFKVYNSGLTDAELIALTS